MKTDIEYLELLERDLAQAATRETALAAPPAPRRRPEWGWAPWVAAAIPILVVAGLIGWLATGGGLEGMDQAGSGGGGATAPSARPPRPSGNRTSSTSPPAVGEAQPGPSPPRRQP